MSQIENARLVAVVVARCAALPVLVASLHAQGLLDTARRYIRDEDGEFQYLADLDLDGDDDVVWFRESLASDGLWREFQAYRNDGYGELAPVGALVAFPDNGNRFVPVGVRRLEDVTGDGWPDLLVAELPSAGSSTLHVYPGLGPSVTFGAPLSIPGAGTMVALGNVDLDPARELGVAEFAGVAWYDWNGAAFTQSATSTLAGSALTRMSAFDLEGDGDDDLVYGKWSGMSLKLVRTTGGAPGTVTSVPLPVSSASQLVANVCDLDGGGQLDVMVAARNWSDGTVSLIPVRNEGGVLVPGAPQPLSSSGIPDSVGSLGYRFGDWDADGDTDALFYPWEGSGVAGGSIVAFFENDGANGFDPTPVAQAETNYEGLSGFANTLVDTVDLDRDGRLDLLGPAIVLFGRGRFESSLVALTGYFNMPLELVDHEGDGDLDLYLEGGNVGLNDGTGAFPDRILPPAAPPERERGGLAGIGDFSGDGRTDFLMSIWIPPPSTFEEAVFEEIRLYADDGLGGFLDAGRASTEFMLSYDRRTHLAHDLDGDGDVDLLGRQARGGYWPNTGTGTFRPFEPLLAGHSTPSAVGDLDADGDTDVVTSAFSPNAVVAWENRTPARHVRRADGTRQVFVEQPVHQGSVSIESESVNLADHDRDGDLDLAFSTTWSNEIRLYANDGAGRFSPGAILSTNFVFGPEPWISHMAFDDLDGDGSIDLFAGAEYRYDYPHAVFVFRGLGDGLFEAAQPFSGVEMSDPGDLDGDGDLDLAGRAIVRSLRFDGPSDGHVRQYGQGTSGSGGAIPVLGAAGPLRLGASNAELRLRRGLGGAPFALFFSLSQGKGPSVPFPGAPTLLGDPLSSQLFVAGGANGQAGTGTFDLDLGPELASLAGLTIYFQAGLVDANAPDGFVLTNGLALTFGF